MNKIVLITVGIAFAGAASTRALDEPALGGGTGAYKAPATVTTCTLGVNC